jgi:predicted XRE-type DNA-binding protein
MHNDDMRITRSSGNVFLDLGFPPEEAAILAMRAELMARLRLLIEERGWTQTEAAERLRIGSRASPIRCAASGTSSVWTCSSRSPPAPDSR